MIYRKYLIKPTDQFDPNYFPKLMDDLDTIYEAMSRFEVPYKTEMLLSFLKDRNIKRDEESPTQELAEMLSAGSLPVTDLQSMFESSKSNASFSKQLENHIREKMKGPALL